MVGLRRFSIAVLVDATLYVCLAAGTLAPGGASTLGMMGKIDIPLPRQIRLTPDGFTFIELFSIKRGRWSDVINVTDEAPEKPEAKSPLAMAAAYGRRTIMRGSAWYTPGGRAALVAGNVVRRLMCRTA